VIVDVPRSRVTSIVDASHARFARASSMKKLAS
jgi:hypothetical protein